MAQLFGHRLAGRTSPFVLACSILGFGQTAWAQLDPAAIRDSIVQIAVLEGGTRVDAVASGFVVSEGYVLTSARVAQAGDLIVAVPLANRVQMVAEVIELDAAADLALLAVSGLALPPATFARDGFEAGRAVYSAGIWSAAGQSVFLPQASEDFPVQLSPGAVAGLQPNRPRGLVEHNATIPPAGYGGPLLNECGDVAGLNQLDPRTYMRGLPDGESANVVFAIGSPEVVGFLRNAGLDVAVSTGRCEPGGAPSRLALFIGIGIAGLLAFIGVFVYSGHRKRAHRAAIAQQGGSGPRPAVSGLRGDAASCLIRGKTGDGRTVSVKIPGGLLSQQGAVIGRSPKASTFVIDDGTLSRRHARFFTEPDGTYIEDLGTTNGTKVNGNPIAARTPKAVRHGDKIELGAVKVDLRLDS